MQIQIQIHRQIPMQREIQIQISIQDGHDGLPRNMHFEMFVTRNRIKMQNQSLAFLVAFWPQN